MKLKDVLKQIGKDSVKEIQDAIREQRDIYGRKYPPLKYRDGKRMIKTGRFVNNAFRFRIKKDSVEIFIDNGYEEIALGQLQYADFFGFTDDNIQEIEEEVDNYADKVIDDFIDKHK